MSEFKSDLIGNRETAGFAAFLSATELVDLADWAASAKAPRIVGKPAAPKSTRKRGTLAVLPDTGPRYDIAALNTFDGDGDPLHF